MKKFYKDEDATLYYNNIITNHPYEFFTQYDIPIPFLLKDAIFNRKDIAYKYKKIVSLFIPLRKIYEENI